MALSMWTKWRKNIKIAFRLVTLYWCWSLLILPLLHSYCDGKHAKWELHILQKHNSISLCTSRQIEWLSRKNEEMSRKNTNYASAISKQEERIHFFYGSVFHKQCGLILKTDTYSLAPGREGSRRLGWKSMSDNASVIAGLIALFLLLSLIWTAYRKKLSLRQN